MFVNVKKPFKYSLLRQIVGKKTDWNKSSYMGSQVQDEPFHSIGLDDYLSKFPEIMGSNDFQVKHYNNIQVFFGTSTTNKFFIAACLDMKTFKKAFHQIKDYQTGTTRDFGEILCLHVDNKGLVHLVEKRNEKIYYLRLSDFLNDWIGSDELFIIGEYELAAKGQNSFDRLEKVALEHDIGENNIMNVVLLYKATSSSRPNQRNLLWFQIEVSSSNTELKFKSDLSTNPSQYPNGLLFGMTEMRIQTETVDGELKKCNLVGYKIDDKTTSETWVDVEATLKKDVIDSRWNQLQSDPNITNIKVSVKQIDDSYKELDYPTLKEKIEKDVFWFVFYFVYRKRLTITGKYKDGSDYFSQSTANDLWPDAWSENIYPEYKITYSQKHILPASNELVFMAFEKNSSGDGIVLKQTISRTWTTTKINKILEIYSMAVDENSFYFALFDEYGKSRIFRYHFENDNLVINYVSSFELEPFSKIYLREIREKNFPITIAGIARYEDQTQGFVLYKNGATSDGSFFNSIAVKNSYTDNPLTPYAFFAYRNQNFIRFGFIEKNSEWGFKKYHLFFVAYDGKSEKQDEPYFYSPYINYKESLRLNRIRYSGFDKTIDDYAIYKKNIFLTTTANVNELVMPLSETPNPIITIRFFSNTNEECLSFEEWFYKKEWNEIKTLNFNFNINVVDKLNQEQIKNRDEIAENFTKLIAKNQPDDFYDKAAGKYFVIFYENGYQERLNTVDFTTIDDIYEWFIFEYNFTNNYHSPAIKYAFVNSENKIVAEKEINVFPNDSKKIKVKIYIEAL